MSVEMMMNDEYRHMMDTIAHCMSVDEPLRINFDNRDDPLVDETVAYFIASGLDVVLQCGHMYVIKTDVSAIRH